MKGWTFAYQLDAAGRVRLFASEAGREPPAGFRRCTFKRYMQAWRERDALDMARLRDRVLLEAAARAAAASSGKGRR